ncbi:MAG: PSD1 and planctomycete cytochrome C domain-containing protein [Pirellulaceae bacterium]|nr:PSD1 and planctomycete cytochrome C domain-containing protein [Pirellulaceae bacterium]
MTENSKSRLLATSVAFYSLVCVALSVFAQNVFAQNVPSDDSKAKQLAAQELFFENEVRPLLAQSCIKCHGNEKQEGGLRLDALEHMLTGGDSGPAVAPGAVADSLIVSAIRYQELEMPPSGQLSPEAQRVIETWVEQGAVWPKHTEAGLELRARTGVTEEDKQYWAFRPLAQPPIPDLKHSPQAPRARTPIDAFIIKQLDASKLRLAPEADARTLLRRIYFDLVGVPPTLEEAAAFLDSDDPQAYEQLVDRLLDDSRYGEKWARHWLDLVRYAESDGFNQDAYRPNAYLYRDWLIESLNHDKPYDQMVLEQIAGDELDPTNTSYLAATGFLRHWIYEYNQRDVRTQWSNILNDLTDVTGEVFFGLGVGCARCHDHKFDPILQRDYFRLQASFASFRPRDDRLFAEAAELADYEKRLAEWELQTAEIRQQIAAIEDPVKTSIEDKAIEKFPIDVRPLLRKPKSQRNGLEEQIGHLAHLQTLEEWNKLDFSKTLKGAAKEKWESLQAELKTFDGIKPKKPLTVMSAGNVENSAPPTLIPSKASEPQLITPASFEVFGSTSLASWQGSDQSTGRRTALAHWINSPENPLPHRVIVNRIWQYHFGTGLVQNASDFGRLGVPPTHPELLDWLATWFIENGRSFKQLHRMIVTSATYRQASQNPTDDLRGRETDLANHLLWHYPSRRLEAEQIRDAMLVSSGKMDWTAGGPAAEHDSFRRSIYTKIKRNKPNAMLVTFDAPDGNASIAKRNVTTTPIQSLLLANFNWPLALADNMSEVVQRESTDRQEQISHMYWRCLQRAPSTIELERALAFVKQVSEEQVSEEGLKTGDGLSDLCHVLFNSSEFLYAD